MSSFRNLYSLFPKRCIADNIKESEEESTYSKVQTVNKGDLLTTPREAVRCSLRRLRPKSLQETMMESSLTGTQVTSSSRSPKPSDAQGEEAAMAVMLAEEDLLHDNGVHLIPQGILSATTSSPITDACQTLSPLLAEETFRKEEFAAGQVYTDKTGISISEEQFASQTHLAEGDPETLEENTLQQRSVCLTIADHTAPPVYEETVEAPAKNDACTFHLKESRLKQGTLSIAKAKAAATCNMDSCPLEETETEKASLKTQISISKGIPLIHNRGNSRRNLSRNQKSSGKNGKPEFEDNSTHPGDLIETKAQHHPGKGDKGSVVVPGLPLVDSEFLNEPVETALLEAVKLIPKFTKERNNSEDGEKTQRGEIELMEKRNGTSAMNENNDQESQPLQHDFFMPSSKKRSVQNTLDPMDNSFVGNSEPSDMKRAFVSPRKCRKQSSILPEKGTRNLKSHNAQGTRLRFENDSMPSSKRRREQKPEMHIKGQMITSKASKGKSKTLPTTSGNNDFFVPLSKKKEISVKPEMLKNTAQHGDGNLQNDLSIEARLAATGNVQHSPGKPMHPFFNQRKVGAASLLHPTNACAERVTSQQVSRVYDVDCLPAAPPFHVTQIHELIDSPINWQGWTFLSSVSSLPETLVEAAPNESVGLLRLQNSDKMHIPPRQESIYQKRSENVLEELHQYLKKQAESDSTELTVDSSESYFSVESLRSRFASYHATRTTDHVSEFSSHSYPDESGFSKCSLWTDLYQPKSSKEVCGNKDSVEFLSTWLQNWKLKAMGSTALDGDFIRSRQNFPVNEDKGCFQEDSDSEQNSCEENSFQNVLLLTGPVGSGKSAAVFACAKEHGFTVIEINGSDNRSGALIKSKFGEAMESHRVGKSRAPTENATTTTSFPSKREAAQHSGEGKAAKIANSVKTKNSRQRGTKLDCKSEALESESMGKHSDQQAIADMQGNDVTILLFEDVDTVFEEDKGFMTALGQLCATTKRPVILTSNSRDPTLPHLSDVLTKEFHSPSTKDLVAHAYMVSVAEQVLCCPSTIERLVKFCRHDLRKLLMFLQFWTREHKRLSRNESCLLEMEAVEDTEGASGCLLEEMDITMAKRLFELDAQHRLWPRFMNLSIPCNSTESISNKVNEAAILEEQRICLDEIKHAELEAVRNSTRGNKISKRKNSRFDSPCKDQSFDGHAWDVENGNAITGQCLLQELGEASLTPIKRLNDVKALARSPILQERRKSKRQCILSDSEDETPMGTPNRKKESHCGHGSPASCSKNLGNEESCSEDSFIVAASPHAKSRFSVNTPPSTGTSPVSNYIAIPSVDRLGALRRLKRGAGSSRIAKSLNLENTEEIVNTNGSYSETNDLEQETIGLCKPNLEMVDRQPIIASHSALEICPYPLLNDFKNHEKPLLNDENVIISDGATHKLNGNDSCVSNDLFSSVQSDCFCKLNATCKKGEHMFKSNMSDDSKHGVLLSGRDTSVVNSKCTDCNINFLGNNLALEAAASVNSENLNLNGIDSGLESILPTDQNNVFTSEDAQSSNYYSRISYAVQGIWSNMRHMHAQEGKQFLLNSCPDGLKALSAVASLTDIISVCDLISRSSVTSLLPPCMRSNLIGDETEKFENSLAVQSAALLAQVSLQKSLKDCSFLFSSDFQGCKLASMKTMLWAVNDGCTLGRFIGYNGPCETDVLPSLEAGLSCLEQDRHMLQKKHTFQQVLSNSSSPKLLRAILGDSFYDYAAAVGRISQLEVSRRAHCTSHGRRGQRFNHYLCVRPWDLSEEAIGILSCLFSYRNSGFVVPNGLEE